MASRPRYTKDALESIVRQQGADHLWHYLDDCITCESAGSDGCRLHLNLLIDIGQHLEVLLAEEKI